MASSLSLASFLTSNSHSVPLLLFFISNCDSSQSPLIARALCWGVMKIHGTEMRINQHQQNEAKKTHQAESKRAK
jgi:hypothetical protein